jgi:hypothetical protein
MPKEQHDSMSNTDCRKKSHATDPGKPNGVHFMTKEQLESMLNTGGKKSHVADPGKRDGIHVMPKEQRDSMVNTDHGRMGGLKGSKAGVGVRKHKPETNNNN